MAQTFDTPERPRRAAFRERPNGAEALALDRRLFGDLQRPGAFGLFFDLCDPLTFNPDAVDPDGIAVLSIRGPLEHHAGWWTSYEDIATATEAALSCPSVRALVHRYDSPGGVVSGCGEAAATIRALAKKWGKPLVAYVDETAASAAYWLASACDEVWLPAAGLVGSVGVILCTVDESKHLEKEGFAVRYITTGARKADLHPGAPVTDEVIAVAQSKVDYLGSLFFADVARSRGMKPAAVQALDAAVFHGNEAVSAGLADGVAGWVEFLSHLRSALGASVGTPNRGGTLRPPPSEAQAMAADKLLTLTKAKNDAAAALAAATTPEALVKARDEYSAALLALADLASPTGDAAAKGRVVEHERYEKKVVKEDPPADAKEDEEPADAKGEDESEEEEDEDPPASARGRMKGGEDEEDEEEASIAASYQAGTRSARKKLGTSAAELAFAPDRLLAAARATVAKATGKPAPKSIRALFGALEAIGENAAEHAKLAATVADLAKDSLTAKVDKLISAGKAAGKIVGKAHEKDMRAQGMQHGEKWLRGRIDAMPKVANTTAESGFVPREGTDGKGTPAGAATYAALPEDQRKMVDSFTAGMTSEQRDGYVAQLFSTASKTLNGASRPSH